MRVIESRYLGDEYCDDAIWYATNGESVVLILKHIPANQYEILEEIIPIWSIVASFFKDDEDEENDEEIYEDIIKQKV